MLLNKQRQQTSSAIEKLRLAGVFCFLAMGARPAAAQV
jgi:hypothetical protein